MSDQSLISLADARIRLSDSFSLNNLNLSIGRGDCIALLGANGSGKSALVAALQGAGQLEAGDVALRAERAVVVSLEEQERLIAREAERDDSDLTDEVFEGTPVSELLDEVCQAPHIRDQLISALGLSDLLNRGFRKLSTGETRKVLLTRALTSAPDLLVLDEPFEGLDVNAAPLVRDILSTLAGDTTIVAAFNRIDEIPPFTTRIIYLEEGVISHQLDCSMDNLANARETLRQFMHLRTTDLALPETEEFVDHSLNPDGALVTLNKGRVAYTDNVVFEDLNWTIKPREHWQVLGPNGSGKTCLLNLITGDHPQCYVNDITLFGYKLGQGESIWQIKQHLGFVSTGLHWDYRLSVSVRSVILSGFYDSIGLYQQASEKQQEIADAWLELLGMRARGSTPFSKLSYGEQRLLLIARAMVKHPPLLLLDEPCLGLDELNRALVLSLVQKVCDEGRTTIIYVTHHAEDAVAGIDNQLVLGGS